MGEKRPARCGPWDSVRQGKGLTPMASNRKALTKRLRFEIFKRDEFTCQYCGNRPPKVILEIDHIFCVAEGGTNDEANLVTSCFDCNRGKADVPLTRLPASSSKTLEERKEAAEQISGLNQFLMERREEAEWALIRVGYYWHNKMAYKAENRDKYIFSHERADSVRQFLASLCEAEVLEAVDIAHGRFPSDLDHDYKAWKYFCGVCWRKIKNDGRAPYATG